MILCGKQKTILNLPPLDLCEKIDLLIEAFKMSKSKTKLNFSSSSSSSFGNQNKEKQLCQQKQTGEIINWAIKQ